MQGRDNPISLNGSTGGDSGIKIQVRSSMYEAAAGGTKTMSISSQISSFAMQGRDNPISLNGSTEGDSGIEIQVRSSISMY